MKRIASIIICMFCFSSGVLAWGQIGHRVVGQIAQNHLSKKAKKQLSIIMGHESLVQASTWMDNIKSDEQYDHMKPWHYVTIPDGETYATSKKSDKGDAYEAIERMIDILKDENKSRSEKRDAVAILTHLVGDIHQPLHVGNGQDRGGNDLKIKWFRSGSNLHRIWDSGIIDSKQLSYTELATMIDHPSEDTNLKSTDKNRWIEEAMSLRTQVYQVGEKDYLSYEYMYKNWPVVKNQLLKGGVRLAMILNEIFE